MTSCLVRVCRDCCCGSPDKHPGVDHDALLARLRETAAGHGRVRVTGCLLACERSNVVVVSPSPAGRRAGARPVWLKGVLEDAHVDAIVDWLHDGGPGVAALPAALAAHETFAGLAS